MTETEWDYIKEHIAPGENLPQILRGFELQGWEPVQVDCDATGWCEVRFRRPFDLLPKSLLEPRIG
jgi:hypothetical protein